ncbi:MAG: lamin tail domain-containing protein [Pseudomonadota bacterium]|nr:lamin tail domain-containing protein [Pseudomonadota bacterium]
MNKLQTGTLRCAVLSALYLAASMAHADGAVSISQLYGGGGNSGATLRNDFVELFNRSSSAVSLSGWCLQYASSAGAFTLGNNQMTPLAGAIPPGGYYLVQLGQGSGGTQNLPSPDAAGLTLMSATSGKLVLLNSCATAFGSDEPLNAGRVVDFVGFGAAASRFEGSGPTGNLANATAAIRAQSGCQDSDNNQADFAVGNPAPRNSLSPPAQCEAVNAPVVTTCPATIALAAGAGGTRGISARDADDLVIAGEITATTNPGISLAAFVPAAAVGGAASATLNFASALPVGNHSVTVGFSNDDATAQSASCTIAVNVAPASSNARIRDIQGAAHLSPLSGQSVTGVPGVVTARSSNGFYMQDTQPDANPATSEGIFVFTSAAPTVALGDQVLVTGTVSEFRPGGSDGTTNLTTTEIVSASIIVQSSGNALPAPVILGAGGRVPPSRIIDNDAAGSVETSGTFDASTDGIDFYESLEGMRVQVNQVVAIGPTNDFGEIAVLADHGEGAGLRTVRGGVVVRADDFNPERIILDDLLAPTPDVNVGDTAPSAIGVLDYGFGNFKLNVTTPPVFAANGLERETTELSGDQDHVTLASFNVENLRPGDSAEKFTALARQIVANLRAPDVVAVMEIQDNNGASNDAVVDASQTFQALIAAIVSRGGPTYQFRQINPLDDQDGGEPGGNIRVGFLFNPARVGFIDRPGGTATASTTVVSGTNGPQLSASPGRIDPTDAAFASSRKPLAGEFLFNGHPLFVIANHFNSKGGDQPLFGRFQPPRRSSEVQRAQQASIVGNFVRSLRSADQNAKVVVLGDLNDFQFSDTLSILKSAGLVDLVEGLPESERYTYVFDGNSQALDHIMVSEALANAALPSYDVVHVNSEFADQTSDHDPEVVALRLPVNEVTAQLELLRSGLVLNRATQLFTGTVRVSNVGGQTLPAPVHLFFEGLPAGVTLANGSGLRNGVPYITLPASVYPAGAVVQVPVQFNNPSRVSISYVPRVYSGQF